MRTAIAAGVGLVVGFVAGIMIDAAIGVGGLITGDEPSGVRYLPIGTAILGVVIAVVLERAARRRSG